MTRMSCLVELDHLELNRRFGIVTRIAENIVESNGPAAVLGDLCSIEWRDDAGRERRALAEVIAVDRAALHLSPIETNPSIPLDARVYAGASQNVSVGDGFTGRAIDALGAAIDDGLPIGGPRAALDYRIPRPLARIDPRQVLHTGVRAIDGVLTLGVGQRVGIFAASGVGKTSLIEQLATQIDCDRVVLCLVGERGREVEGFWRMLADREDADRFTLVAATSDESAALRVRAVRYALALADHWRDRGEHVVLMIDSATRMAMALREIGLAAGAPPTVRAYTPNVFSTLPKVVEQCGAVKGGGAISAIFTILSETDDVDDPIVELMKSLLDGHIVLSRGLAEQGHFPAIDVVRSVSRQSDRLVNAEHQVAARAAIGALAAYDEARVMIEGGLYKAGSSLAVDRAITLRVSIGDFLRQPRHQSVAFDQMLAGLEAAVRPVTSS